MEGGEGRPPTGNSVPAGGTDCNTPPAPLADSNCGGVELYLDDRQRCDVESNEFVGGEAVRQTVVVRN